MKNTVIVYPMPLTDISNLKNCIDYPTMQAHYIYKYTNKKITAVGTPYNWLQLRSADKHKDLFDIFNEHKVNLNTVKNLIITGVNAAKYFTSTELTRIKKSIKGDIYQIDDSNFNQSPFCQTFSHYTKKSHANDRSIELSLAVASDLFLPHQDFESRELVVHVDHRWTKTSRLECFDEVKECLRLLKNLVERSSRWKGLKIIYHTETVEDIDIIGTYDPKPMPITELAELYGSCHLAFLSHAETLGQYPLEMLSAGASILMHRKMIPKETRGLYPFKTYDNIDYENFLNTVNENTIRDNRQSVIKYDYSLWVEKMLTRMR